ncbi:hypothetical protein RL866_004393 [Escherichia coli]|nr:hypothetical protein [Escherichia coli]ELT2201552.1 hypothetical protein [Escherichia coli]
MNEFIKERFSYLADNKKENAPELNVSYGIDKNFLYGAGVSISSVLINNSDINFVFHVFTDYVDDDYLKSFNETAKQFNTSIIVYLIDPKYFAEMQKQYKHLFAHGEYIKGITSLIKYKLKK